MCCWKYSNGTVISPVGCAEIPRTAADAEVGIADWAVAGRGSRNNPVASVRKIPLIIPYTLVDSGLRVSVTRKNAIPLFPSKKRTQRMVHLEASYTIQL